MRHVYAHVPFCRRRCSYCDFAIAVRRRVPEEAYLAAVERELEVRLGRDGLAVLRPETVYLGGGTPSLLSSGGVERLVRALSGGAEPEAVGEVTLEANPDDVAGSPDVADRWRAAGITRVSLGAQSFDGGTLEWMHRTHAAVATDAAVAALRRAGVPSLSLDLIFARPDDVGAGFSTDLERALALEPEHLSVYGLTLEPRTPLARWVERGAFVPLDEERYREEFLLAHETLTRAGYDHYEVSNYARPGHRSRHNGAYWTGAEYLGVGPSAHSFFSGTRRWNERHWAAYRDAIAEGRDPIAGSEELTLEQRHLEEVYLGLRTIEGVREGALRPATAHSVDQALTLGWLTRLGGRLGPTPEGWLRLDALVPHLTHDQETR